MAALAHSELDVRRFRTSALSLCPLPVIDPRLRLKTQHCWGTAPTSRQGNTMPPGTPLVTTRAVMYDTLTGARARQNGPHLEVRKHDAPQHARHVPEEEREHGGQGCGSLGQQRKVREGSVYAAAQRLHPACNCAEQRGVPRWPTVSCCCMPSPYPLQL